MRSLKHFIFPTVLLFAAAAAHAAKAYQVTGTITKLTDKIITIEKANSEKWEIDRESDTKVDGDLKVGAKVTVEYTMSAKSIEVKAGKSPTTKP